MQGAQTSLRPGLGSHMGQELLKGEQMADQAFERQGFEPLRSLEDVQTAGLGIELQRQTMAN